MWLLCLEVSLCLEGGFLFWSLFSSAWKHFFCLLSVCIYSSDHGQLRPSLTHSVSGPYMGMFGAVHYELEEQNVWFLVRPWQSPRPVWSPWRTVAENQHKHPRVRLVDLTCLLSVSGMHWGYGLSIGSLICCMWRAWSLGIVLNGGKGSRWPGAIESRVETGRKL